ncbi:MAG: cation-translocating P-type ATPase [Arcanobacterium sp.]
MSQRVGDVTSNGHRDPSVKPAKLLTQPTFNPLTATETTIATELGVDPTQGLNTAEVSKRLATYGRNELEGKPPTPKWQIFLSQLQSPLIYLLLAAIVISAIAWFLEPAAERSKLPIDALVIAAIVVLNSFLGYFQEIKAANAVAALQAMTATKVTVLRDGTTRVIDSAELVPGDILILAEGDEVGADGRLIHAAALKISEASLTGESVPVDKQPGTIDADAALGDRTNMVFKGTAVTQGTGRVIVTNTGMTTEMGHIAGMLDQAQEEPTPLTKEINELGAVLSKVVVVIAAITMVVSLLMSDQITAPAVIAALILAVSLAVAAIPEGLPAILTMVLSMGVQRMANENAIVKDLNSVETLGSASVIASDKTGTLTQNEMTIQRVITASGTADISGIGYTPEGSITSAGQPLSGAHRREVAVLLTGGSIANDASLTEDHGEWTIQGDPTEAAFIVASRKLDQSAQHVNGFERRAEVPFTSARKMMSVVGEVPGRGKVLFSKGAPDVLLANCSKVLVGTDEVELDEDRRTEILNATQELAEQAFRTLAVAYRVLDPSYEVDGHAIEDDENNLVFVGFAGLIDPPRATAAQAIKEARGAGIRIMMITGDHPATAARIARDLGITDTTARALTGNEIDELTDSEFERAVREVSVFARVAPKHKMRIVTTLQAQGEIVAMTGDGVNDAPALKSADIGVAMGITGTEVTKEAGNMILADDNFATIVSAVRNGRLIFDNIRKFLRFLLSSNMGEVFAVFLGTLLAGVLGFMNDDGTVAAPLLATQILWINLLTDSFPALAMGVDPAVDDVMARKPRRLTDRVLGKTMWMRIVFLGLVMGLITIFMLDWYEPSGLFEGHWHIDEARTAAFTTLVFAQLFNAFNSRSAYHSAFHDLFGNKWLWGAVGLATVLQIAVVEIPLLQTGFGTVSMRWQDWLFCVVVASIVLWVEEIRKFVARRGKSEAELSAAG